MNIPSCKKEEVRALRAQGYSLGEIQKKIRFAKSTIYLWTKDIVLSTELQENIKKQHQLKLQKGRVQSQIIKKKLKLEKIEYLLDKGRKATKLQTQREKFLIGVALYWAEGFKNNHEHRLGFCNSDPQMIRFYISWLKEILSIEEKSIILRLTLNISYKERTKEFEEYWSKITNIPLSQFTKTFYQTSIQKKQYNNDRYHGVLRIHVKNSLDQLLLMKGWIDGLKQ